jgi:hypothetical protein
VSYRELPPPPALAAWVECMWQREGGAPVRVVPDGCIDIVWIEGAGTHIVGANTTAFVVDLAVGTRVAGARLRPGAAPPLLGIDAIAMRDGRVAIEDAWDDDGRRLALELDAADDRVGALLVALAARARAAAAPDPLVRAAVARLDAPAVAPVSAVARELASASASCAAASRRPSATGPSASRASCACAARWTPPRPGPSSAASPPTRATPIRRTSRTSAGRSWASRRRACSPRSWPFPTRRRAERRG